VDFCLDVFEPNRRGANSPSSLPAVIQPGRSRNDPAAQRPYAAAAFAGTPSGPPAWKTLPCWYLLGTEDKAIPPALQHFMAERANATIVEVPASHVSFVSQPEAATQLILRAVEAVSHAESDTV
jgi:pimeloyl-ACP methyl ester carboxylesterase